MRLFSYIFLILIIVLGLTFAVLNANSVNFNYYLGARQISLSLLLIYTLGFGIILGLIVSISPIYRLKKANLKLKGRIKEAEKELGNLRTLPIKDSH